MCVGGWQRVGELQARVRDAQKEAAQNLDSLEATSREAAKGHENSQAALAELRRAVDSLKVTENQTLTRKCKPYTLNPQPSTLNHKP